MEGKNLQSSFINANREDQLQVGRDIWRLVWTLERGAIGDVVISFKAVPSGFWRGLGRKTYLIGFVWSTSTLYSTSTIYIVLLRGYTRYLFNSAVLRMPSILGRH
jgi:hypothetical protein